MLPRNVDEVDPVPFVDAYANSATVFGEAMPVDFLVTRIKGYDWRASLVRLANIAAILANDPLGPKSSRALGFTTEALNSLTASTPAARAMLARGRDFVANARRPIVVAHEEAIVFLQHAVLLHGGDNGQSPGDGELALWLLGASDHLEAWLEPESRVLTPLEEVAAEMVKVFRFNRSSVDELRLELRARNLFAHAPRQGPFSLPSAWQELQERAFGGTFERYFEAFANIVCMLSHTWAKDERSPPVLPIEGFADQLVEDKEYFMARLSELTGTRSELIAETQKRMKPGALLPHSPTALLRKPFVNLENGEIVASSPWYVRALLRTGIWARYLDASKAMIGNKGGDEWSAAFGQMLEDWCRDYSQRAVQAATISVRLELPITPGSADEIEDIVLVDGDTVLMCSVKARLVREDIARHALSKSKLLDWYEDYFFKQRTSKFRAGVIEQLSARIDMLRAGDFEPRILRNAFVLPVLVTFDHLCANKGLYQWLEDQCKTRGLLQQSDVGPIAIAVVDDFERLIGAAAHNLHPSEILRSRMSEPSRNERLDVVLYRHNVPSRLPGSTEEFRALSQRILARFGKR